jgi:hypothetical protein
LAVINQADLENAMSTATVETIFEDSANGIVNTAALAAVIQRAESTFYSYIARNYPDLTMPVSGTPPESLKWSVLEFAIVFARDRKPEYWSESQGRERHDRIKAAHEMADRFAKAEQMLYDSAAAPPANVGGSVRSGDPLDIEPRPKFFGDGNSSDF